jgi:hypothetical protein
VWTDLAKMMVPAAVIKPSGERANDADMLRPARILPRLGLGARQRGNRYR